MYRTEVTAAHAKPSGQREELAEYITGLEITYATSTNTFVNAEQVKNWQAIKIVKIKLTATLEFSQKILCRSSEFIVALRNRV